MLGVMKFSSPRLVNEGPPLAPTVVVEMSRKLKPIVGVCVVELSPLPDRMSRYVKLYPTRPVKRRVNPWLSVVMNPTPSGNSRTRTFVPWSTADRRRVASSREAPRIGHWTLTRSAAGGFNGFRSRALE
jgi:hypothetical protein